MKYWFQKKLKKSCDVNTPTLQIGQAISSDKILNTPDAFESPDDVSSLIGFGLSSDLGISLAKILLGLTSSARLQMKSVVELSTIGLLSTSWDEIRKNKAIYRIFDVFILNKFLEKIE